MTETKAEAKAEPKKTEKAEPKHEPTKVQEAIMGCGCRLIMDDTTYQAEGAKCPVHGNTEVVRLLRQPGGEPIPPPPPAPAEEPKAKPEAAKSNAKK